MMPTFWAHNPIHHCNTSLLSWPYIGTWCFLFKETSIDPCRLFPTTTHGLIIYGYIHNSLGLYKHECKSKRSYISNSFKKGAHNKASRVLTLHQCVCLANFNRRSTSNPKCHVMFSITKMNVNWHLHFLLKWHLNVTCLAVRVISIFKVLIDM